MLFSRVKAKLFGTPSASLVFKDLSSLLSFAPVGGPLGQRIQWIEDLLEWVRIPVALEDSRKGTGQLQAARVRYLFNALEKNPAWQSSFRALVLSVLQEAEPLALFCETGMGRGDGVFSDAAERVLRRLLPVPQDERDLLELLERIFSEETDADWIENLDSAGQLARILFQDAKTSAALLAKYLRAMGDALIVLGSQAEALGLSADLRLRSQVTSVSNSAFYRLRMAVADQLEGRTGAGTTARDFAPIFTACRAEIQMAFSHLEEHGVSVAIVYRLEKLERILGRLESLLAILYPDGKSTAGERWLPLVADLVRKRLEGAQVRSLIQRNLHMLARKIVERTGASGEHYITTTRREYGFMLLSAAGGGVLTAFTALAKTMISRAQPAPFFEGLFQWINFSGSFLTMQALHLTLATKQPSMTAPALASKLKESNDRGEFANLVARLTRSQFAAAVGNLGATIPAAIALDLVCRMLTGGPLLTPEHAAKTIESLHPWHSLTIPFAMLTGVLLWLSSIVAGWVENWFVYRRLPEALAQSVWLPTGSSGKRSQALSGWLVRNVGPVGGNLSLGFLLAFTPILGRFFGLALDVRHVTISMASLTLAACALPQWDWPVLLLTSASVVVVGLLNFSVSFALALATAAKARDLGRKRLRVLRQALALKFRQQPAAFFFPPREAG